MKKLLLTLFLVGISLPAMSASDAWVNTDRLNRRTCPNSACGIVGQLFFREKVKIFEEKTGWARISKHYDASCRNGKSEYVDSGNASCTEDNGIVQGRFAEWVSSKYLSEKRPADPSEGAIGDYALVKGSDDYRLYKDAFAKAASELIKSGRCTEQDFIDMGGWFKSPSRSGPIYFTYCGGMHTSNRLYLNAATGEVFR
jgi:hypothetical protein